MAFISLTTDTICKYFATSLTYLLTKTDISDGLYLLLWKVEGIRIYNFDKLERWIPTMWSYTSTDGIRSCTIDSLDDSWLDKKSYASTITHTKLAPLISYECM